MLRQKFRIAGDFRPFQEDIINASLSGKDVVGILSTGSGKSLCYQLPAVLSQSRGLTLVISPLLSLIVDQVLELRNNNIEAVMMTSLSLKEDIKHIYEQLNMLVSGMSRNGPRLLYVTPERLASSKRVMSILEKLFKSNRLDRIVIDEAHCCSQYGHDFRKDYLKLGVLKVFETCSRDLFVFVLIALDVFPDCSYTCSDCHVSCLCFIKYDVHPSIEVGQDGDLCRQLESPKSVLHYSVEASRTS